MSPFFKSVSPSARFLAVVFLMSIAPSCGQAILTAPVGSTIVINVNPPFIAANGDTAVVSVLILEPAGTPVPDGTVVQFFTTMGKIQEQAKTNDGVARVNLISDTNSGTATIKVFSGAATTTSDVVIGSKRPASVIYALIDQRIDLSEEQSIARFRVTVLDSDGNRVPSVPVRFRVTDDPTTDRILETGDVYTDNNGNASGSVQTRRTTPGTIRIHAEVLSATALSVDFTVPVIE